MNNEIALMKKVNDYAPNGMRNFNCIEDQMILTQQMSYYGYEDNRNDDALSEIFNKVFSVRKSLPDFQSLIDAAWDHNYELLDEMALQQTIEEYRSNGIDIYTEIDMDEFDEKIEDYRVSCEEMYSYSNAFDEGYEISRYAIKNGIGYVVEKDSDAFERELCNFDVYFNKDLLVNHSQLVMFDELYDDDDKNGSYSNYGKYVIQHIGRE